MTQYTFPSNAAAASPAELDALFQHAVGGEAGVEVHYGPHQTEFLQAFAARASTDALAVALEASAAAGGLDHLYAAMSDAQIEAVKRARLLSDAALTEMWPKIYAARRRWYFLTRTKVSTSEFEVISAFTGDGLMTRGFGEGFESTARLRSNLANVKSGVRAWVAKAIPWKPTFFASSHSHEVVQMLWAASLDGPADPFVVAANAVLATDGKAAFRKERTRAEMASAYGLALVAAPDPLGVLAALGAGIRDKGTLDMLNRARAILETNLGLLGVGTVSWAAMEPENGAALLAQSPDPEKLISEALASADANGTLRILFAMAHLSGGKDRLGSAAWSTVEKVLARLDHVTGDDLAADMTLPLWGKRTIDELFKAFVESIVHSLTTQSLPKGELLARLRALHDASTKERFRGLLKGVLGETSIEKLRRLASACDLKERVTRRFVERTAAKPAPTDVSRLYGSPIGVSAATWPRRGEAPMQHVITLATSALSAAAQKEFGSAVAVAAFVEAIDSPDGAWALVRLSASDLERHHEPIVAPAIQGVRLDVHEIAMPAAAFAGGAKKGPLKELRTALDHLDGVLASDVTSPKWIQDPEPRGTLIAELRASFAPQLNFGDQGAIYLMTDGVAFQCA